MIRVLWTLLIAALVLYSPVELTRLIILDGRYAIYTLEVALIWIMYTIAIMLVFWQIKVRK